MNAESARMLEGEVEGRETGGGAGPAELRQRCRESAELLRRGKLKRAAMAAKQAVLLDPHDLQARLQLAVVLAHLGHQEGLLRELGKARHCKGPAARWFEAAAAIRGAGAIEPAEIAERIGADRAARETGASAATAPDSGPGEAAGSEFYEGADVRVRTCLFPKSDTLMLTFTGRAAHPPIDKGFGETFFLKRGISAIHFISKANHWWQTAEMSEAIGRLRAAGLLDGYRRLIAYGSSMGGYGALIRSAELRPDQILVISPQYSIDSAVVPFEKRWRESAGKLRFVHDDMDSGLDPHATIWAIVDPYFLPDTRHIDLVERHRPINRIPVAFAGHNTARQLNDCGLLTNILLDVVEGRFVLPDYRRNYRRTRVDSVRFWLAFAQTLVERGREAWGAAAIQLAAGMVQQGARMGDRKCRISIFHLALALAAKRGDDALVRRWGEALRAQDPGSQIRVVAEARLAFLDDPAGAVRILGADEPQGRRTPEAGILLAQALLATGEGDRARAVLEPLLKTSSREAGLPLALAEIHAAEGAWTEAHMAADRAVRRNPRLWEARILLARALAGQGDEAAAWSMLKPALRTTIVSPRHIDLARTLAAQLGRGPIGESFAARCAARDALSRHVLAAVDDVDRPVGKEWGRALLADVRARQSS